MRTASIRAQIPEMIGPMRMIHPIQGQQQLSHGLAGISQIEVVHAEGAEEQAEQAGDDLDFCA